MSTEFEALTQTVDRLLSEHTRLSVENRALTLRLRELEQSAASNRERVKQAKGRLDALMAQLPLETPVNPTSTVVQEPLL
jgi:regulator of replication initiation timing